METGAHFQQARHPAGDFHAALGRFGNPAEDFQEGAFAGAIATNDAQDFALLHLEGNVLERPKGALAIAGFRLPD